MSIQPLLDSVSGALAGLSFTGMDDAALLSAQSHLAETRRRIDAAIASASAEVVRRSHRDLGYDGLAQRLGAGSPEKLVQQVTGVSRREAGALVRIGSLDDSSPLSAPVAAGAVSVEAAEVIRSALDGLSLSPEAVASATAFLVALAPSLTIEQLAGRARSLRDELDADGVPAREAELRERRYLRLTPAADGMVRLAGLLDPEAASLVGDSFDAITSPRRGPRFVDSSVQAPPAGHDPRTLDQRMADALVDVFRVAAAADDGRLFGQRRPAVRVLVAERDLRRGAGAAHLEATSATAAGAAVSLATAARLACEGGIQPVVVGSNGDALRLGRVQRLFTSQQRLALAARDGGCRFAGCDRPPSWCEAHHITPWSSGGRTDVDVGVLLCRHHHLLVHNNGWQIRQRDGSFEAVPPRSVDRARVPIAMPRRSAVWERVVRAG